MTDAFKIRCSTFEFVLFDPFPSMQTNLEKIMEPKHHHRWLDSYFPSALCPELLIPHRQAQWDLAASTTVSHGTPIFLESAEGHWLPNQTSNAEDMYLCMYVCIHVGMYVYVKDTQYTHTCDCISRKNHKYAHASTTSRDQLTNWLWPHVWTATSVASHHLQLLGPNQKYSRAYRCINHI